MKFGRTWWGEQWLYAFNGIDYSNRLPRGRRYANNGSVRNLSIVDGFVYADVKGRRATPYSVAMTLEKFSDRKRKQILNVVDSNPVLLSRLLNRQLPQQMLDLMTKRHIRLFPQSWKAIEAMCSCPDWAVPCKHIAAVTYLISNEIDKNPFIIFELHGMDLAAELEDRSGVRFETFEVLGAMLDAWSLEPVIENWEVPIPAAFDEIDLTDVPELEERFFTILQKNPLFCNKDFHNVLANHYKRTARETIRFDATEKKPWAEAEHLKDLVCVVNESGHFLDARNRGKTIFTTHSGKVASPERLSELIDFLVDLPSSLAPQLSHHLLLWHQLLRMAIKLITQGAYLPAVLLNSAGETMIHWHPAIVSRPVKKLIDSVAKLCPPDLVLLEHSPGKRRKPASYHADAKTQVITALHLLISFFVYSTNQKRAQSRTYDPIDQMFFAGQPQKFDSFETEEHPKVIRHWLSRLHLPDRAHQLHLLVEEQPEENQLGVTVQVERDGKISTLAELFEITELTKHKANVLGDLAVLAEYLPEIEQLYNDRNPAPALSLSLAEFTPIFRRILPALRMLGIRIILPKSLSNLITPRLSLSLSAVSNDALVNYMNIDELLEFDWKVAIGDLRVPIDEFRRLVTDADGIVRLLNRYVLIDGAELEKMMKRLDALPESLSRTELLKAGFSGELDEANVDLGESAQALFRQLTKCDAVPLPAALNAILRPYQERGFQWLIQNIRNNFGSLLADDMGLGKTLQVITVLLHLKEKERLTKRKALVVVPTSLLTNWRKEIEKFAPSLKAHTYHGAKRSLDLRDCDVILTSYGLVRSDIKRLSKHDWQMLVIDEAQNIKNPASAQTKAIKQLNADCRICMSGTPVENRLREYWSLFDFANKGYLGTQKRFHNDIAAPIERDRDQSILEYLRTITGPFILRRMKTDRNIISDLPDKIETNRYCSLSKEQASLYQSVVQTVMKELDGSDEGIERRGLIFKLLNALKQVCNSPAQYRKSKYAIVEESGKLAVFMEIMKELAESGEKALIFTQYTTMGRLLVEVLRTELGWKIPFLHGGLTRTMRDSIVDSFQNERSTRALILSLKAGGTGLNLTAASQVIHYDLWWNPAVEAQATDRAFRIGQHSTVLVHRLITENTFEEKIDAMIQDKKELADLTVSSGEKWITELSDNELRKMFELVSTV